MTTPGDGPGAGATGSTSEFDAARNQPSVVSEMGLATTDGGDVLHADGPSYAELWYPGTKVLRTSVLATWADIVTGLLAAKPIKPQIPVTLDLDVHLFRSPEGDGDITMLASVVKAGRSIVVCDVWFTQEGADEPFGFGHGSFMASPNPADAAPDGFPMTLDRHRFRMQVPLAERAGVRRIGPGIAEMPRRPDGLNAVGGIQGGLVTLVAEEAVRAAAPDEVLESLSIRYLHGFRTGPAHAVATVEGNLAHVRVHEGEGGRIGAVGTARIGSSAQRG